MRWHISFNLGTSSISPPETLVTLFGGSLWDIWFTTLSVWDMLVLSNDLVFINWEVDLQ